MKPFASGRAALLLVGAAALLGPSAFLHAASVYGTPGTDAWQGGFVAYANSGAGSLLTTNGIVAHFINASPAADVTTTWEGIWGDFNDITVGGGTPPAPPTGTLNINRSNSGAGGIQLNWNLTPPATTP